MKNILLTGAAGFIGSNLAHRLLQEGNTVVGIDDLNDLNDHGMKHDRMKMLGVGHTVSSSVTTEGIERFFFFKTSVNDETRMKRLFSDHSFDAVIHLAAHAGIRNSLAHPQEFLRSNVLGFETLLRTCSAFGVKNVVFASSSSVYGERSGTNPFRENDRTDAPVSVYAASKKAKELLAHTYASLHGLSIVGLRLFTVYGPWNRTDMATYLFMEAIQNERPLTLYNEGRMIRDFTYVGDVVKVISLILGRIPNIDSGSFQVLNVGNGTPVVLSDYVSTIERLLDKKAVKTLLPAQAGDVSSTFSNSDKLMEFIGYAPTTSVEEGLKHTVRWFLEHGPNEPTDS